MNISALLFTLLLNKSMDTAKTEIKETQMVEYSVSQVISHRELFTIDSDNHRFVCKSLTPCFGLYKGETAIFTKNPESYNGDRIFYMDNSECRIDYCERIF